MNLEKAIEELKTNYFLTVDAPNLEPCIFCGGKARLIVRHPLYGLCGAWVRCRSCGACGPNASIYAEINTPEKFSTPLLPESLARGIAAAQDAWNSRTVDRSRMGNLKITRELPA